MSGLTRGFKVFQVEAFASKTLQQRLVALRLNHACPGENPQVFSIGLADGSQLVILIEVDHPVVPPDKRRE